MVFTKNLTGLMGTKQSKHSNAKLKNKQFHVIQLNGFKTIKSLIRGYFYQTGGGQLFIPEDLVHVVLSFYGTSQHYNRMITKIPNKSDIIATPSIYHALLYFKILNIRYKITANADIDILNKAKINIYCHNIDKLKKEKIDSILLYIELLEIGDRFPIYHRRTIQIDQNNHTIPIKLCNKPLCNDKFDIFIDVLTVNYTNQSNKNTLNTNYNKLTILKSSVSYYWNIKKIKDSKTENMVENDQCINLLCMNYALFSDSFQDNCFYLKFQRLFSIKDDYVSYIQLITNYLPANIGKIKAKIFVSCNVDNVVRNNRNFMPSKENIFILMENKSVDINSCTCHRVEEFYSETLRISIKMQILSIWNKQDCEIDQKEWYQYNIIS